MSVRVDEDEPVRGPPISSAASTTTWDFISAASPVITSHQAPPHPLELPHSSSYRPWEGSELLLRGTAYYNNSSSNGGYGRNTPSAANSSVDDRLPSFESQFNEPPSVVTTYGGSSTSSTTTILAQTRTPESVYTLPHPSLHYPQLDTSPNNKKIIELDKLQPQPPHHLHQQGILLHRPAAAASSSSLDTHPTLVSQLRKKTNVSSRTTSDEQQPESSNQNPGQVAAISSTDPSSDSPSSFKSSNANNHLNHHNPHANAPSNGSNSHTTARSSARPPTGKARKGGGGSHDVGPVEKSTKKKRKRCGECSGCQKKDNCGDCAPCRNEKSHQICKVRRCERLIEKKPKKGAANSSSSNISSDITKLSHTPRSQMNRQIDLHPHQSSGQPPPHFGFTQSTPPLPPMGGGPDAGLWCTSQPQPNGGGVAPTTQLHHQTTTNLDQQPWTSHYQGLGNSSSGSSHGHGMVGPPCTSVAPTTNINSNSASTSANLFEHHAAFDTFIRRPTPNSPVVAPSGPPPILLSSPINGAGGPPIRTTSSSSGQPVGGYHHELQPPPTSSGGHVSSGFIPINGNTTTLGYNLAVNTETKPYLGRSGLISPRTTTLPPHATPTAIQGNSLPGCPTRPTIEILPNYSNNLAILHPQQQQQQQFTEGPPGELMKRTGVSPDSTTAVITTSDYNSKSFLACRAEDVSSSSNLEAFSALKVLSRNADDDHTIDDALSTSKLISNVIIQDIESSSPMDGNEMFHLSALASFSPRD